MAEPWGGPRVVLWAAWWAFQWAEHSAGWTAWHWVEKWACSMAVNWALQSG